MNPLTLLGCPFKLDGATPAGFDCWGLVEYVRREAFGWNTPVVLPASHATGDVMRAIAATVHEGRWTRVDPPGAPGDVVALAYMSAGNLHHVGVALEEGVLHAFSDDLVHGSVVLTPFDRLRLRFGQVEVYRWPN